MRLTVRVVPNSAQNSVEQVSKTELRVKVTASPVDGKANEALIKLLAKYYKTTKSEVEIMRGFKNRNKIVEVSGGRFGNLKTNSSKH
jgi:uncharacterized protein (TIGR00251 family)